MLSFIAGIGNAITGAINDVKNWILRLIQAVYSFIDGEIDALGREILDVYNEAIALGRSVEQYAVSIYTVLSSVITTGLHDVISWASNALNTLSSIVNAAIHDIEAGLDDVRNRILQAYHDIESWVMQNIWDPLWNFITTAIHWIENEGAFVYDLLTHPDKLVKLIASYIWQEWLTLLKTYAAPIGRWLLHSMIGLAGDLIDVFETIIAALL